MVALILITVLNDGSIISIAYDNVTASKRPEEWNLKTIYTISGMLGLVACASSLICLELGETLSCTAGVSWGGGEGCFSTRCRKELVFL